MIAEATILWHYMWGESPIKTLTISHMNNTKTYFKSTGESLFCDEYLYQEAMRHNPNSFLVLINQMVDWKMCAGKILKLYKAKGTLGAPAYKPEVLLKMMFLEFLFNVSDREIERFVNDSISMKNFLGFSLSDAAPDHSSLSVFRSRIVKKGRTDILHEMFEEIIRTAQEKGVKFGKVQVIDSTHTTANVNRFKDKQRQKPIKDGGEGKPPRDPDARTSVKRIETKITPQKTKVKVNKYIYGHKNHLSVNSEYGLITSIKVTHAGRHDGHLFEELMKHDLEIGVAKRGETIFTADKGYEDGENSEWLNQNQLKDAIFYKGMAKKIKEATVKHPVYTSQEEFQEGAQKRYIVERTNGALKKHGGLGLARYLGLEKMEIQSYLTAIVFNLKTLVKIIHGVTFRANARF